MQLVEKSRSKLTFSLIMATVDRVDEVENFFEKLLFIDYDLSLVEVIIVDQNIENILEKIFHKYKSKVEIKWIKSNVRGTSNNRNKGISIAKGEVIAFADDDCYYYNNTFKVVNDLFNSSKYSILFGRVFDRESSRNVLKNFPHNSFQLKTLKQIVMYVTAITIFVRRDVITKFDEQFGLNAKYYSTEEADIVYNMLLNKNASIYYSHKIEVYHPQQNFYDVTNRDKIFKYGIGFGALYRKYFSGRNFCDFIMIVGFHLLYSVPKKLIKRQNGAAGIIYSLFGRIWGFVTYDKKI